MYTDTKAFSGTNVGSLGRPAAGIGIPCVSWLNPKHSFSRYCNKLHSYYYFPPHSYYSTLFLHIHSLLLIALNPSKARRLRRI
jgi:hypothetical protein